MIHIKKFVFNPFQENTYILHDDTGECVIIDPGCYESHEMNALEDYISDNNLKPVKLLYTHCHVDHILGNNFVCKTHSFPCSCWFGCRNSATAFIWSERTACH